MQPVAHLHTENGATDAGESRRGRCSLGVFGDLCAGVFDFRDKRGAKPGAFSFVELSGMRTREFTKEVVACFGRPPLPVPALRRSHVWA